MNGFTSFIAEDRRLQILRFLVELQGAANETVILTAMRHAGFAASTRSDIRADLEHLERIDAVARDWVGEICVVKLTERGDELAHGRIAAGGVKHERDWRRGT
jgi:hypothetical protein